MGDVWERREMLTNTGFEVLTAVVMNVAILCDIVPRSSYVDQRFGGMYHLHLQCRKLVEQETSMQYAA
jgi:hypothetical protein